MKLKLPPKTMSLVDHYLNLKVKGHLLPCPYYENVLRKKGRPVFEGKGTPEEIEIEASKLFDTKEKPTLSEINNKMRKVNLGIDCSGLATRILDTFLVEKYGRTIRNSLTPIDKSPLGWVRHFIRTYTNISANMITSKENTTNITDYKDIKPGDLIRAGKQHVGIVMEVEIKSGVVEIITFIHSISDKMKQAGVRKGIIRITKPSKKLEYQKWYEVPNNSMYEEFLTSNKNDRGFRRLKL